MPLKLIVGLLVCAALLAGCGGDDGDGSGDAEASLAVPWVDPDGDPPYIGSLSVNPGDGSIFMGTNTGLFRIPKEGGKPSKVTGQLKTPNGEGAVSELGTSDFHALSRAGDILVAPLYGQAQILLSRDDGKTFEPRVAPMALVDLAADPADPKRWAATSETGVFVSE